MKIGLMFPNKYLKADDLDGRPATLTITRVTGEELRQEDNTKKNGWIVYFEETAASAQKRGDDEKRLVLNKTNAVSIASMHGRDTDFWIGKKITLYATTCRAFGKEVDCIRVKEKKR